MKQWRLSGLEGERPCAHFLDLVSFRWQARTTTQQRSVISRSIARSSFPHKRFTSHTAFFASSLRFESCAYALPARLVAGFSARQQTCPHALPVGKRAPPLWRSVCHLPGLGHPHACTLIGWPDKEREQKKTQIRVLLTAVGHLIGVEPTG